MYSFIPSGEAERIYSYFYLFSHFIIDASAQHNVKKGVKKKKNKKGAGTVFLH